MRKITPLLLAAVLVATSPAAFAYDCNVPQVPGETWRTTLDNAKRIFWRHFPPAEARKRSQEAYLAAFSDMRDWRTSCCLPRLSAAFCNAEVVRAEAEIQGWDWRSPP